MTKRKVYLCGDMLRKGNQLLRSIERDKLNQLDNIDLFNPMDDKTINDKKNNPQAEQIFVKDTNAILESDIIVADAANDSVGTVSELGQIWGINYILEKLHNALLNSKNDDNFGKNVRKIMQEIPMKEVYWQTTDIRDTDIPEVGHRRSHSLNQYLYGMLLDMSGEAKDFDEIVNMLKNQE